MKIKKLWNSRRAYVKLPVFRVNLPLPLRSAKARGNRPKGCLFDVFFRERRRAE